MSQDRPEGWYDDPAGDPRRERYWDGASWSTTTRLRIEVRTNPPAGFSPSGRFDPSRGVHLQPWDAPTGAPVEARAPRTPWGKIVASVLALLLLTGLVAGLLVLKPFKKLEPEETASPSPVATSPAPSSASPTSPAPTPSATAPSGPASSAILSCTGGSASSGSGKSTTYTSAGLAYDAPTTWGWRYDRSQWAWLDDPHVWGRVEGKKESDQAAIGVALGGLAKPNGFTTPQTALDGVSRCLTTGMFAGGQLRAGQRRQVSVGGVTGEELSFDITDPAASGRYTDYHVIIRVFDLGRTDQLSSVTGFYPTGAPALQSEVDGALATLRKA